MLSLGRLLIAGIYRECFDRAATPRGDYGIRTMRPLIDWAMDQMTKRNPKEIDNRNLPSSGVAELQSD